MSLTDEAYQKLRTLHRQAEAVLQQGNSRTIDRQHAQQIKWLANLAYGLDEQMHNLREQIQEDEAITRDRLAKAWQQGHETPRDYVVDLTLGGEDAHVIVGPPQPNPYDPENIPSEAAPHEG